MAFSQFELSVFEASFYSCYEDIDKHYAKAKASSVDPNLSLDELKYLLITIVE
jgi:hypothetical protein